MNSVFFDSTLGDDARREALYAGQLFVYSARPSVRALVELARRLIRDAFGDRDPERPSTRCRSKSMPRCSPT